MSVLCGLCKERHEDVAAVRACFASLHEEKPAAVTPPTPPQPKVPLWASDPATPRQVDYLKTLLEERDWGSGEFREVDETFMNVCDGKAVGKKEASDAIEALLKLPRKGGEEPKSTGAWASIPEGRYALVIDGDVKFFKVDRPTQGKWAGRVFTKLITGGVGSWQEYRRKNEDILPLIEKMGARESATLFGIKARHCGRCMSPLSTKQSRAAGYGEHCAGVVGWPYPSVKEAERILLERGEDLGDE